MSFKLKSFDHIVITTADVAACIKFYRDVLGMRHVFAGGRHAFYFGDVRINVHTRPAEFLPAASYPLAGSLDICLITDDDIENVKREIEEKGWPIEAGPVERNGAKGRMKSIYLRDADGNLIEVASYE